MQAQAADFLGQLEQAIDLARSSIALYESLGVSEQSLRSRRVLAFAVWRSGRFGEAVILHRRNLAEAQALNHLELQAYIHCNLGHVLWMQGDLDAGEKHLYETQALAIRLDDTYLLLSVEYHLGNIWAERAFQLAETAGTPLDMARRETQTHFKQAIELAQARRSSHMIVVSAVDLAAALAQWGEPAQARPLLLLAQQTLESLDDHVAARAWTMIAEAEIALAEGAMEEAIAQTTAAIPLLEQASPPGLAQAYRIAAVAWIAQRQPHMAASYWTSSLAAAARCGLKNEEERTRRQMERAKA